MQPVYFDESTRPACLQTYLSDENPDTSLTVAGWGVVSPICKPSDLEVEYIFNLISNTFYLRAKHFECIAESKLKNSALVRMQLNYIQLRSQ